MTRTVGFVVLAFRVLACALACASASSLACAASKGPPPEATLSHSLAADAELRPLLTAWSHGTAADHIAMGPEIAKFGARRGSDETGRVADVLLAWIALEQGKLDEAARQAEHVRKGGPPGTVSDLAITVSGASLRRQGKPDEAIGLLTPLVSKLIDPWARSLFNEEIVRSAIEAGRTRDALALMRVWLREASLEDHPKAHAVIAEGLKRASRDDLLELLDRPVSEADEDKELRQLVAARLAQLAREGNDTALAQRLLAKAPALLGEDAERVAQLASGASKARVEARTVGLLLDLRDEAARRRGAEIVQGVAFGLGLPGSAAHLVSRDARGREGRDAKARIEDALLALSADGASVIIAGSDAEEAEIAADFAEAKHVPVILLEPPLHARPEGFSFVLGVSREAVETTLVSALVSRGASPVALVTDDGEKARAPRPELTLVRGCHEAPGGLRSAGVAGVVLVGAAECSREALVGIPAALRVAAGLEASDLALPAGALALQAGLFPFATATPVARDWMKDHPALPSFRAALARDAAVLAWGAVQGLPAVGTEEPGEVVARRARVLAALAAASVPLWTTEASGFGGGRVLPRTLSVREVARDSTRPAR